MHHRSSSWAKAVPTAQEVITQINPGTRNEWLMMIFQIRVVPERSNPMAARSEG